MRVSPRTEERLLTPAEAAALLSVSPKTLSRWTASGQIRCTRTLGGHRRFFESDILAVRAGAYPRDEVFSDGGGADEFLPVMGITSRGSASDVAFGEAIGDDAAAAAVIADAVAIALEAAATAAAEAVITTSAAVRQAAQRAADAAQTARGAREFATAAAAAIVARDAKRTANLVQMRADAAAARAAQAVELAAEELLRSIGDRPQREATDFALREANTARAAAHAMTQHTLRQSVEVEGAVAETAAQVARIAAVAEDAIAKVVSEAAQVIEEEALATATALALKTDARAVGVAIAAREAAAAMLVAPARPSLTGPSKSDADGR